MAELLFKDEVYAIVGAAMEVHRVFGCGFLEAVYQEAMGIELAERKIPFLPQVELPIQYKGRVLKKCYLFDFVAYEKIIVELKAQEQLFSRDEAQILNYLKASGKEVGVLINFGVESLQWKRIVLSKKRELLA
jgi:GxxExxY protein